MATTYTARPQTKLTKEQRAWLTALRSGDYTQGQRALHRLNGDMCCLGVLCDVVDPEGWVVRFDYDQVPTNHAIEANSRSVPTDIVFDGQAAFPPEWVLHLVGLNIQDRSFLASQNDSEGWSFNQIADWLEMRWRHEAQPWYREDEA